MRFAFVQAHAEEYAITTLCRLLRPGTYLTHTVP